MVFKSKKAKMKRGIGLLMAAIVLSSTVPSTVLAENVTEEQQAKGAGTTVQNEDEFLSALKNKAGLITIEGSFTVRGEAQTDGRMKPVMIPENTVIQGGSTKGSGLTFSSPVQLEGDQVTFKNMELKFNSSDAMGSVPHREIFLAGHSLVMDNVSTYLEGSDGSLGGFGGTEKELLPSIYAGGFPNTNVGTNAAVTIQNSNKETVFQGIYMGHGEETDAKVPYSGKAVLNLDTQAVVRDGVYTKTNSEAEVFVSGAEAAKTVRFYGNENTVLTVTESEVLKAVTDGVGHVILDEGATLVPTTTDFLNITVQNGGCLNLNALKSAVIAGNFTGGTDKEKGYLILNKEGTLTIQGTVSGITQFQTGSKMFPGALYSGSKYIIAKRTNAEDVNFVLADANKNNHYVLEYDVDGWKTVCTSLTEDPVIERVEVKAPSKVNLKRIMQTEEEGRPDAAGACNIVWKDQQGNAFDGKTVEENMFYDYVIVVKSEYWESTDAEILKKTDWGAPIYLSNYDETDDLYYLTAAAGAKTGKYTFLFCSEYYDGELSAVSDVKALSSIIMEEVCIELCDTDPTPEPTPNPTPTPTPNPEPTPDPNPTPTPNPEPTPDPTPTPEHTHKYTGTVTKEATCTQKGQKTYRCSCGVSYTEDIALKPHNRTSVCQKASMKSNGSIKEMCQVCKKVFKNTTIYRPGTITLSKKSYTYDGKLKKPKVTVKDSRGKQINSSQYQVSYKNHKNVGKASVTVQFKENYSGSKTLAFSILPKETGLKKLTAKSKGMTVSWKKQNSQTTGYLLQYSTSSKFSAKTTKTVTIKSNKTTSKTITKLKAKKKYYVRIGTYKTVKVNGKSTKLCSKWSKVKFVTTKKK